MSLDSQKYAIRTGCLMLILRQKMQILDIYQKIKINSMTRNADSIKKVKNIILF